MTEIRRYPVDKQTFRKVIDGHFVYVDKTDLVYKMTHDYEYVFLSRPRRFGKSLMCSTLKEYFSGNKELFRGLKIDALEKEWTRYPVIDISFANAKSVTEDSINELIESILDENEKKFGVAREGNDLGVRFSSLVTNVAQKTGQNVVIIIDEYDAPMLDTVHNDDLQESVRAVQNKFFAPLKTLDEYIRFVFLTGITKFSQMSIFSTLNNLQDISLKPEFETICGISHEEMLTTLRPDIQSFAEAEGRTFDEMVKMMKIKYDGYSFSRNRCGVFNPFEVMNALNAKELGDYWFDSGTPTALLKLISKFNIQMEDYDGIECSPMRFKRPVEKITDLVPFLYQSGYLTIKDYRYDAFDETVLETYTLGYPNGEVRTAFANCLFTDYYKASEDIALRNAYVQFRRDDDIDEFIKHLQVFFDGFPFSLNNQKNNETHYHSIIYTVLTSFGANISANVETALGKADLILRMPKTIYVIEIKNDRSVKSAKRQIQRRRYAKAYLDSGKRIVKLALKFSSRQKNITGYEATEEKVS
ncbi:MAG: AAA family ATPase [Bacteroidales bacterium]|nr:AAA family ATPase [Bacteroidales bacterium]